MSQFKLFTLLAVICLLQRCFEQPANSYEQQWTATLSEQQLAEYQFTDVDIHFLQKFSITKLGTPPVSASNRLANDKNTAQFGKKLFFDKSLSRSKQFACSTCHIPSQYFTDGLKSSKAAGITGRSTPTLLGSAYSPWLFWDGRKDSLWSQALGPIEDVNEINTTRVEYVRQLLNSYPQEYQKLFGDVSLQFLNKLPAVGSPLGDDISQAQWTKMNDRLKQQVNRVFSNAGKAIMAYQRQLVLPLSRFDRFLVILSDDISSASSESQRLSELAEIMSPAEVKGLRLFVGKANCASCHNGPLFTNYEFHNIGAPDVSEKAVELGRYQGVKSLLADEFTCLSSWSDADPNECAEMLFLKTSGPELVGALKTPTLRNIGVTAPYMQFGQFENLGQVLAHYNKPSPPLYNRKQHPNRPHFDILPLELNNLELLAIEGFLKTLTSPLPKNDPWWGL